MIAPLKPGVTLAQANGPVIETDAPDAATMAGA